MFSASPLKADIAQRSRHVRFVPIADVAADVENYASSLSLRAQ
jgi:hypothetical protein